MKRFLSVVAILALIFALAVPSFADDATLSVSYDNTISSDPDNNTIVTEDGETLYVVVSEAEELTTDEADALTDAVYDIVKEDAEIVVEVVDVAIVDENGVEVSEDYFEDHDSLKVSVIRTEDGLDVVAVLYYNSATGEWDEATNVSYENGVVTFTVTHLCTVAFVLAEDASAVLKTSSSSNTSGSSTVKSAQTDYNTALWAVVATVLLLGAGYCFTSAKKKTEA